MKLVTDLEKDFKTLAELQAYANSQYAVIQKLKTENEELKKQLATKEVLSISLPGDAVDDDLVIATTQLKILSDKSLNQELTLEECRKSEVYAKMRDAANERANARRKPAPLDVSDEALMKTLELHGPKQ